MNMNKSLLGLSLLISFLSFAQTRTEELIQQREELMKKLTPEKNSRAEDLLRRLKDERILQRSNYGYRGFGLKMGRTGDRRRIRNRSQLLPG